MDASSYVRTWDGRSDDGASVSSGIYYYKLVADKFSETKKVVHMK
jgi:flagellar hook assembly protein FlgD